MATRPKFARMANYLWECVEASHIFLKKALWRMWASLASPGKVSWRMSTNVSSPTKTGWRMSTNVSSPTKTGWQMSVSLVSTCQASANVGP
jgi:hypothetical protein